MRSGFSFHSISLSIALCSLFPNLSHSLQTSSSRFLQAFQDFFSLGKFLISHSHAFHVLKPRIWGFLGKFWGFSNLLSFCWNFGMGFKDLIIKSHALHHISIITVLSCILDVCNWLCVGRFGLGWAHNAISFVCHMFMHFPCIRSLLFNILVIFELFWSFSDCFFLPLLYSVYVSCVYDT